MFTDESGRTEKREDYETEAEEKGVEGQEMTQTPREKEQEKDGGGKPGKKTTG